MSKFKMRYFFLIAVLALGTASRLQAEQTYSLNDELVYRINFGSTDDIKVLLDKGANPNTVSQGAPVLNMAIERNDKEAIGMVKALLDKGANPNIKDKNQNYPIVEAAQNGQAEMVAALVAKGADVRVKSANGTALVEIAQKSGPEIAKPIQAVLDKEKAYAESLRTPERFKEIIRLYSFHSCNYQYWSYVLTSRQDPDKAEETEKKVAVSKAMLAQLLEQVQRYYPTTKTSDLQHISDDSAQKIYDSMDIMISNRNRAEHGIGKDEDAKSRCQAIADAVNITFVPVNLRQQP